MKYVKEGEHFSFHSDHSVHSKPGTEGRPRVSVGRAGDIHFHVTCPHQPVLELSPRDWSLYLLQAALKPVSSVGEPTSNPSPIRHTFCKSSGSFFSHSDPIAFFVTSATSGAGVIFLSWQFSTWKTRETSLSEVYPEIVKTKPNIVGSLLIENTK